MSLTRHLPKLGTLMIGELALDIVSFDLYEGKVRVIGMCDGPLPAKEDASEPYAVMSPDGQFVWRGRMDFAWPEILPGGHLRQETMLAVHDTKADSMRGDPCPECGRPF